MPPAAPERAARTEVTGTFDLWTATAELPGCPKRTSRGRECRVYQIRIHGRGGQGVVTAAELLSTAAFAQGAWAQAFPSFGSERTGAPVAAFCRISDAPIRTREPIAEPDCVIVQDATVGDHVDVLAGLRPDGRVLVNSAVPVTLHTSASVLAVPATELAQRHIGRPVPNAALIGGFAGLTGLLRLDSVESAIRDRFPPRLADGNVAAARAVHRPEDRHVLRRREEGSRRAGRRGQGAGRHASGLSGAPLSHRLVPADLLVERRSPVPAGPGARRGFTEASQSRRWWLHGPAAGSEGERIGRGRG